MIKNTFRLVTLAMLLSTAPAFAQGQTQTYFGSPEQAADAFVGAVEAKDNSRLTAMLGPGSSAVLSSGDAVADENDREKFLKLYAEKHNITFENKGETARIDIGPENWPFAVPVVHDEKGWRFDGAQGAKELLYRRIGRNELDTIQSCLAYVDAQEDYAQMTRKEKGIPFYAQKIISSEGAHDGLYWTTKNGAQASPLGELMAKASKEGYGGGKAHNAYHGYFYKILTKQGVSAKGGEMDYVANGKLIGGFALIAWPAEYGNSGVMTFIVNHEGLLYQRDLGRDTSKTAAAITAFNPDKDWEQVNDKNQ